MVTETAMRKQLVIDAKWDSRVRVWVATSEDVPGVAVEADTTNETMDILKDVILDLMEANGVEAKDDLEVVVRFAQREESLPMKAA